MTGPPVAYQGDLKRFRRRHQRIDHSRRESRTVRARQRQCTLDDSFAFEQTITPEDTVNAVRESKEPRVVNAAQLVQLRVKVAIPNAE